MIMLDRAKNYREKATQSALKSVPLSQNNQLQPGDIGCIQQEYRCATAPLNLIESNTLKIKKDPNLKISGTFKPMPIPEIMRGLKISKNRQQGIVHYDFTQSYGNVCGCQNCHQKKPLVCTFRDSQTDILILCDKNSHRLNQARLLEVKNYITAFAGTDILEKILLDERVLKR